jgi:hypothetical protein
MELNSSDEEDKRGPSSASASACKPLGHDQPHRLGLRSTFARRWVINSIILVCVLELYRGSLLPRKEREPDSFQAYKGHLYLYFQSVQSMYASEHIMTLSSGDLRVSDHPVVVQMRNFPHLLEICVCPWQLLW